MTLSLTRAVSRQLRSVSTLTAMVGTNDEWGPWIFREQPHVSLEGTGTAMIVVSTPNASGANPHNTMRFPTLQIEIYVDPPRNDDLNPEGTKNGETPADRAGNVFDAVDLILHLPAQKPTQWGDGNGKIRVLGSRRASGPEVVEVPGGDGMVRCLVRYEVTLG